MSIETINPADFVEAQDVDQLRSEQLADLEAIGLPKLGSMPTRKATEIKSSKIGVGFETLDRFMFDPERVYPLLGGTRGQVGAGADRLEPL